MDRSSLHLARGFHGVDLVGSPAPEGKSLREEWSCDMGHEEVVGHGLSGSWDSGLHATCPQCLGKQRSCGESPGQADCLEFIHLQLC